MYYIGIDMGSTASKTAIFEEDKLINTFSIPTGWSGVETAKSIYEQLKLQGITQDNAIYMATGYGRVSVSYAKKSVTEITCHGRGGDYLFHQDGTIIDIGGQDTKVIEIRNGKVGNFLMNDKCSAGTGRFLEIMANTLGVTLDELSDIAQHGGNVTISSMCTVFAESEVINLIGSGRSRADIAYGVVESVVNKVSQLCGKLSGNQYFLTGGLCDNKYILVRLRHALGKPVVSSPLGRYAGAIGAAIIGKEKFGQ